MDPTPLIIAVPALGAFVGHVALCAKAFNRLHASGLSCRTLRLFGKGVFALAALVPAAAILALIASPHPFAQAMAWWTGGGLLRVYLAICWAAAAVAALSWLRRRSRRESYRSLLANDTTVLDVAAELEAPPVRSASLRILTAVPGNQVLRPRLQKKVLALRRLQPALAGLRIAHLSDLHVTGGLTQAFFDLIADQTNELDPDLAVITGDLVDRAECLSWAAQTLGRIESRHGVYFVLGNHDRRVGDIARLRRELVDAGLIDLGGKSLELEVRGEPMVLAGDERPWFGPPPDLARCPEAVRGVRPLRILLAHTPDRINEARRFDFDLLLAGHTHGGQIRFPGIGPIVTPSRYGLKYASGVFYEPPTLMHVSRGISSAEPLRWNCPPELALLVLQVDSPVVDVPLDRQHGQGAQ